MRTDTTKTYLFSHYIMFMCKEWFVFQETIKHSYIVITLL